MTTIQPPSINTRTDTIKLPQEGEGNAPLIEFDTDDSVAPQDQVTISPAALKLLETENMRSRFLTDTARNAHLKAQLESYVTVEELENGTRRPFASEEDARLSLLSMKELVLEGMKLPNIDENGHLKSSISGTEQGDKIKRAKSNIAIEANYTFEKSSEAMTEAVEKFKHYIETELGVEPDSYEVIFSDGKIQVNSVGGNKLHDTNIERIQSLLDAERPTPQVKSLISKIEAFNEAASALINHVLTIKVHGGQQNQYLPEALTVDAIMEGIRYDNASPGSHLQQRWLGIVEQANLDFRQAREAGTHLGADLGGLLVPRS